MALSKRNRRGLLWILIAIGIIAVSPRIISNLVQNEEPVISFQEMQEVHHELNLGKKKSNRTRKSTKKNKFKAPNQKINPNELSQKEWEVLGLSEKQSAIVVKFAKRGLRSNNDLQKIYVFPTELFDLIKDSLIYPSVKYDQWETNTREYNKDSLNRKKVLVDISVANQEELETIPGIGPFFAKKIVELRRKLGGFVNKNQLLDVWKFDQEKLDGIDEFIVLSKVNLTKIDINLVNLEDLKSHPYISYSVANSIVKMRELKGDFKNVSEIKESKLINEELYNKIVPYLTVL